MKRFEINGLQAGLSLSMPLYPQNLWATHPPDMTVMPACSKMTRGNFVVLYQGLKVLAAGLHTILSTKSVHNKTRTIRLAARGALHLSKAFRDDSL